MGILDDFFNYSNPLNSNYLTVYILIFLVILFLFILPDKLKIFSTRGVVVMAMCMIVLVAAHQINFVRDLIPYF